MWLWFRRTKQNKSAPSNQIQTSLSFCLWKPHKDVKRLDSEEWGEYSDLKSSVASVKGGREYLINQGI